MFYFFSLWHISKYDFCIGERVDPPKPRPFKNENAEDNKVTDNNIDPNDINNNTNDNNNINGGNANQPQPMDVTVRVEPTQDNGKRKYF